MASKRVLITGASGLLGSNLVEMLRGKHVVCGVYHEHPIQISGVFLRSADLRSPNDVRALIKDFQPEVIVHCAALADVDICEKHPQAAIEVNVNATRNIVDAIRGSTTRLIHISTDLVYDGSTGPHREGEALGPQNHYALTKQQAETVALLHQHALVLRTNFFGWSMGGRLSLAEWGISELARGRAIKGFVDAMFSTLYVGDLAGIIDCLIGSRSTGIYNCGSRASASKFEFLKMLAGKFGLDASLIHPTSIENVQRQAKRGKDLTLDVSKLEKELGMPLPSVAESVDHFYAAQSAPWVQAVAQKRLARTAYPHLDVTPYGRQFIDDEDIRAVDGVLKSSNITQGPAIEQFEKDLCQVTGAKYAVAVNSGTAALHIACLAAGITPGDEVITSPITFVASANCVAYCGGTPVFADIDERTANISPDEIAKKMSLRTKAVIPVHFAGQSCDMEAIRRVVGDAERKYGHKISVIEDASHALGSRYQNHAVGAGQYSDMTIFSFHPVKHITTAEGGAVMANNEELSHTLRQLRSHGITGEHKYFVRTSSDEIDPHGPGYYEQQLLGYNYRMNDIQAALGSSQLKKLEMFKRRRADIVRRYDEQLSKVAGIRRLTQLKPCETNYHLYIVRFDWAKIGQSRTQAVARLKAQGIIPQVHYIPVHLQPFYQKNFATKCGDHPKAEAYYQECLSLPLYPAMSDVEVGQVIKAVKEVSHA